MPWACGGSSQQSLVNRSRHGKDAMGLSAMMGTLGSHKSRGTGLNRGVSVDSGVSLSIFAAIVDRCDDCRQIASWQRTFTKIY